jgi:hypothetical protein
MGRKWMGEAEREAMTLKLSARDWRASLVWAWGRAEAEPRTARRERVLKNMMIDVYGVDWMWWE